MPKLGMEEIRKKQVIYSTLELIGEDGIGKLTLDRVAKKAGVSKGVVTYYFKNKEEMIYESYKYMLDSFANDEYAEYLEQMTRTDIIESITKSVLGDFSFLEEIDGMKLNLDPSSYKYLLIQMFSKASNDQEFCLMVREYYTRFFEGIYMVIDGGTESHLSKLKAYQFMALLDGLLLYKVIEFEIDGLEAFDVIRDFIKTALAI